MSDKELQERFEKAIGTYSNSLTKSIAEECVVIAKEYTDQLITKKY